LGRTPGTLGRFITASVPPSSRDLGTAWVLRLPHHILASAECGNPIVMLARAIMQSCNNPLTVFLGLQGTFAGSIILLENIRR
jgi:hypothetical protein